MSTNTTQFTPNLNDNRHTEAVNSVIGTPAKATPSNGATIPTIASDTFTISLVHSIVNKDKDKIASATYHPTRVTLAGFAHHVIGEGKTFAVGIYKNNHRAKADFISSQLIALDFDDIKDHTGKAVSGHALTELLEDELIAEYGTWYASPSHTPQIPKWRVFFVLDRPIQDGAVYEDLVARLLASRKARYAGLDASAKDSSRQFFGHKLSPADNGTLYHVNTKRLPVAMLEALPKVESAYGGSGEKRMGRITIPQNADRLTELAFSEAITPLPRFIQTQVIDFIGTSDNRNPALYALACRLNDCVGLEDGKGLITKNTAYRVLYTCAIENGYLSAKGVKAFDVTFRSAFQNVPKPIENEANIGKWNNATITNDFLQGDSTYSFCKPYVNQLEADELDHILSKRLVMVMSATGTGKTEFIKSVVAWWAKRLPVTPRVLVITYRQKLVFQLSERLGYLSYQDHSTYAESTTTTLDSLHKFSGQKYDIIVMDEFVQCLSHLVSSATLHKDRITALQTLEALMKSARLTLAMDANASDTAGKILESMNSAHFKSHIRVINTYLPKNRKLDLYAHRSAFLARVMESASEGFTTLGVVSIRHAEIADSIARGMGLKTLVVTSHTSAQADVAEAVNNINTVQGIDLLIYTHSLGVGCSIDRPVKGAFLWACTRPLTAHDHVQMLSRARNAEFYVAHGVTLPKANEGDEDVITPPSAQVVYGDIIAIATGINGHLPADEDGAFMRSAQIWSRLKADEIRLNSDSYAFVKASLANGFHFGDMHTDENEAMAHLIASESKAHDEAVKDLTITSPAVSDEELEAIRQNGQMSREARYGNVRYKIEKMVGESISANLYDKLGTGSKRAKIRRLADVLADNDTVQSADRVMNFSRAWQDMTPRHAQYKIFWQVMSAMGMSRIDDLKGIVGKLKEEIVTPAIVRLFEHIKADIRKAFKRYDQTPNAFTELKWLLRQFGINFATPKRARCEGELQYTYSLDIASLEEHIALAQKVLACAVFRFSEKPLSLEKRNISHTIGTPTPITQRLPIGGVTDKPVIRALAGL